jgi:3-methyladenine DNA glycosylase AlkD
MSDQKITLETAIDALKAEGDETRVSKLKSHFGAAHEYIGIAPGRLEEMARAWRKDVAFPERLELAKVLWASNIFDARLMAAKLLTQARIKDDFEVWAHLTDWLAQARTWAEVDALSSACARRVSADNTRMGKVYKLMRNESSLLRRAALSITEPLAKATNPTEVEKVALARICEWLPEALNDESKDVHRTAQSWLRSLSKHDFKRARAIHRGEVYVEDPEEIVPAAYSSPVWQAEDQTTEDQSSDDHASAEIEDDANDHFKD